MSDFETKDSLRERIKELEAQLADKATTPAPAASSTADELADKLANALIAARGSTEYRDTPKALHKVINTSGMQLGLFVTDTKTSQPRHIHLTLRGDFVQLTEDQVVEIQEKYPDYFTNGWLSCPDLVELNANCITDVPAFLGSLTIDSAESVISKITALSTLYNIYHHIETLRFNHLDDKGNELTVLNPEGKVIPVIKENLISPLLERVEAVVQRRVKALSGVRLLTER